MATPKELAAFQVKTAVAVARLDEALGPEDEAFRLLVIHDLTECAAVPVPYDSAELLKELVQADNPITALGEALATSYSAAAALACTMIVDEAVVHLFRSGGEAAIQQFLDDLDARAHE